MYLQPNEAVVRNAFLKLFSTEEGRLVYLAILEQLTVARPEDVPGIQAVIRLIERGMHVSEAKNSQV